MGKKMLPVGVEDFAEFRQKDFYYVDKTGMIEELLGNWGKVNLFTRPRRFGKSLNMSMLKYFFEIGTDRSLFDGLRISENTRLCEEYLGQYPIISISLKTAHADNFENAKDELSSIIAKEALRFPFLATSEKLTENERKLYNQLVYVDDTMQSTFRMSESIMKGSLNTLSMLLHKHYGKKVILLVDEYDVPLAKANERGYYKEMIGIVRNMLDAACKSNANLEFAILTGCLRVSKESIFTGMNNLKIYSLLDAECDEYFGFTDKEVKQMLDYYKISEYYELTKEWYDGYRIGHTSVYNPWDVINWCNQLTTSPNKVPKSYWANSSGNEELHRFIERMGDGVTKIQLERLVSGETVQKSIEEQLTYDTIYDTVDNMWSLLYATGYLTQSETPDGDTVRLMIPNMEVRYIFSKFILKMFEKEVGSDGALVSAFCTSLKNGDRENVECTFRRFMARTISIRDTAVKKEFKENFYHGILLGILAYKSDWSVDSNRESGDGYYDIAIEIEDESIGIIIEVKYAKDGNLEAACKEAMQQIEDNNYIAELKEDDMHTILKYGIACYKKDCRIVLERETRICR